MAAARNPAAKVACSALVMADCIMSFADTRPAPPTAGIASRNENLAASARRIPRRRPAVTAGLLLGIRRAAAARFSFLLAIPAVGGAGLVSAKDMMQSAITSAEQATFAAGFLAAAISGYFC